MESPAIVDEPRDIQETDNSQLDSSQIMSILPAPSSTSATPTTSEAPSEADSTQPTTPSSAIAPQVISRPLPNALSKTSGRLPSKMHPVVPVVPNIPALARSSKKQSISAILDVKKIADTSFAADQPLVTNITNDVETSETVSVQSDHTSKTSSPEAKAVPKSWADLVRSKAPVLAPGVIGSYDTSSSLHNIATSKGGSLSEVLRTFNVVDNETHSKTAFIKPRGLINTGNMCYMNSVCKLDI